MESKPCTKNRGFSLLELLMLISLGFLIVGIGRPFLVDWIIAANERSAAATLRSISRAQIEYALRSATFGTLEQLVSARALDKSLQDGEDAGYKFSTQNVSAIHFEAIAIPVVAGSSGNMVFYIDETSVIRSSGGGLVPSASSPPL